MTRHTHLGITLTLLLAFGTGCSLVVSFDRDRIGDGGADAGTMMDGGPGDGGPSDAGFDAGPPCGNGVEDTGEACDDGNTTADDGCSATCTVEDGWTCSGFGMDTCTAVCGDGMTVGSEACDDGFTSACGVCNADCTGPGTTVTCGDGAICADTEACDDSNTAADDGCSADCAMIETGWVCSGEPSTCEETCNNGVLDMGETCDDGANVAGDGCSPACQTEPGWSCAGEPSACMTICGDGMVITGEEECDDSNTADDDGCSATCTEETGWTCTGAPSSCDEDCGDAMVVGTEACDDGNTTTETACPYGTATCMACNAACDMALSLTGNVCGDGSFSMGDEGCDDGDTMAGDGCSATCTVETGWTCTGMPMSTCTPVCGDSRVRGGEACDDGDTVTETECDYGTPTCTLCNMDCSAELMLTGSFCGDGTQDTGLETCDDANTDDCGTCSGDCGTSQGARAASGTITVTTDAAGTTDGSTFTLNNGDGDIITFELDNDMSVTSGNVRINLNLATDASSLASVVATVIDGQSALQFTVAVAGAMITLTNNVGGGAGDHNGALGNRPITSAGLTWTVSAGGMTGGRARDCVVGTPCRSGNDCASRMCTGGVCT
ncbi:MAG: DUF4215 domain-containing protein [Myxococcales bacterium]|nr:DUF4215 domain-containing protein [Myxococcales bacterium]